MIYLSGKKGALILPLWHFYFSVVFGGYFDVIFFEDSRHKNIGGENRNTSIKIFRIPYCRKLTL